jgi:putative NIF3 family GTP cyclohydrolase 1 type 2
MVMISAKSVAQIIETIAPIDSGVPGDELGFVYGDRDVNIRGVACIWNAQTTSIQAAVDRNLDMLIVHEQLFYRPQLSYWHHGPLVDRDIVANRKRRELLAKHHMVVYRCHSNWDALADDGVPDQAVAALDLKGLKVHAAQKFFKVHELSSPETVGSLAERAKSALGVPVVRVFGDERKKIRRFCFLVGGFGENQTHTPQVAMEMGADCVIIGEMSEFIVIAAMECGIPVIETLHSCSEIPAIKQQAQILQSRLPEIRVEYISSGALG